MTEFRYMLTFPPFRISRSCPLALSIFRACTWRSIIKTIKRVHGLSIHHLVGSLDGIAKVRQPLNRRRIIRLIKITREILNLGFSDVCLDQVHRFSANLNLVLISGANSWSSHILCARVLSSLGLLGQQVGFLNVVELIVRNLDGRVLACLNLFGLVIWISVII